jgi:small-conductance mechanosensitive channel
MNDERSLLLQRLETAQADCMDDGQAAAAILLQDARGLLREQAKRIETLEKALREVTPYVEAFRREEKRADDLARDLDDLRAALAARIEKLEAALREIADRYANTLPAEVAIDALGLE